jgi:hypothetical protein
MQNAATTAKGGGTTRQMGQREEGSGTRLNSECVCGEGGDGSERDAWLPSGRAVMSTFAGFTP